jgi:bacillopeptidase F
MRTLSPRSVRSAALAILISLPTFTPLSAGGIDAGLQAYLLSRPDEEPVSVIVSLKEQADVRGLLRALRREKATRRTRHERIVRALRATAARTQAPLVEYLSAAEARGDVLGFTPHWISNLIVVQAPKREILRLREHPAVAAIEKNFSTRPIRPVETGGGGTPAPTGVGVAPGVLQIHADRVWHELGFTGAGRLIANLDTGVDGAHPALSARWRGNEPGVDPAEAWLDLVYGGSTFPVDYNGHGTHVMGTMTGLGEGTADTIGVAWGARWIACNAIDQVVTPEFDNDVITAFEWLADPDGDPSTIDDVPDVVQNSWGIDEYFSGDPPYTDCDSRWWAVIDNCEAAGVVVTFSAGNEGPGPMSLRSPADRATTPHNAFSIGAVDTYFGYYPWPIASFSSRGPSACGGPWEIKPEVCAPGVRIYSSIPGGGYDDHWSGTSMAGPHVAGVVALMREAHPDLAVD